MLLLKLKRESFSDYKKCSIFSSQRFLNYERNSVESKNLWNLNLF